MTDSYDVLVAGGGPAGLAAGIALARLGRSVLVLEKSRYDRARVGETFGPELKPLLQALDAWEDFAALDPVAFREIASSWGGASLAERASIFHPRGEGWHVERTRFDQMLAGAAVRAGVRMEQGAAIRSLGWNEGVWRARTQAGSELSGRYLVDASGRGAPATTGRFPGRRWLRMDRQVAFVGLMSAPATPLEPALLLEAVEDGWWYSVPQPGGALLAVLITDADLLPVSGRAGLAEAFLSRLDRSAHTAARRGDAGLAAAPWIVRSDSGLLIPDRGLAWRAIGDAAMACDPLAGDGVVRALRSALEAAPEINAALSGHEALPPSPEGLRERLLNYADLRARYYEFERRWPDSAFWARRRPMPWKTAPLFLQPQVLLRWNGLPLDHPSIAPVEALIPPGALRELCAQLQALQPAHQALGLLRSNVPVSDRQLLVGMQMLVTLGFLLSLNPSPPSDGGEGS